MRKTVGRGIVDSTRRQWLQACLAVGSGLASASSLDSLAQGRAAQRSPATKALPAPKPEVRSITVAIASPAALAYLPLLVAQQNGFFTQYGLDVQLSEQQSPGRAINAVSMGQADVVCAWLENILSAPARGLGLQSFVLLGATPMMSVGVSPRLVGSGQSAPTWAMLRGRKMGVVALNSPTHTVALAALRQAGVRAAEVGWVSVGSTVGAQAALRSGQIDGLVYMDPLMLQLEQRGEILPLADMRGPTAALATLGRQMPSSCLAGTPDFFQRLPATAQALSDGLVQALMWVQQASLRDILRLLPDAPGGMDAQGFVASFERLKTAYSPDGLCSREAASDVLQAMHEAEPTLRLEKIDAWRSINNSFAQRSGQRLKA
jgi:NitT/TauT family transport system substrate-binding protein